MEVSLNVNIGDNLNTLKTAALNETLTHAMRIPAHGQPIGKTNGEHSILKKAKLII